MRLTSRTEIRLAAGVQTPLAEVGGPLGRFDAIELSVPAVRHMIDRLGGSKPDFDLALSNGACELLMRRRRRADDSRVLGGHGLWHQHARRVRSRGNVIVGISRNIAGGANRLAHR